MSNYPKKPAARRGVELKLSSVRVEVKFEEALTKTNKPYQKVTFFAPVNLDDNSEGEVKYDSILWDNTLPTFKKAPKNSRFDVRGFLKKGNPWKTQDGRTVTPNDFVITSIEVVKKSASPVQEVEEEEEGDESNSIPF